MTFEDLSPGDETRRNGDYVGLPHNGADIVEGEFVDLGSDGIEAVTAPESDDIVGVLYTYQYFHDADGGEKVDQERDATVKTSGTVKADVSGITDAGAGDVLGANGEAVILSEPDDDGYAEVLLR